MDIQALRLHQNVIEVRYPSSFRGFDHAGELTDRLLNLLPSWVLSNANPTELNFVDEKAGLSATIGINSSRVVQLRHAGLQSLNDDVQFRRDYLSVLTAVLSTYRVTELARIGYRRIYHYKEHDARNLLLAWQQLPIYIVLPDSAPPISTPGDIVVNFDMSDGLFLRFGLQNLQWQGSVGHAVVDLTDSRIVTVPRDQRTRHQSILSAAERVSSYIPKHGLVLDLDWNREDIDFTGPDQLEAFIVECDQKEGQIKEMLRGRR